MLPYLPRDLGHSAERKPVTNTVCSGLGGALPTFGHVVISEMLEPSKRTGSLTGILDSSVLIVE